MGTLGDSNYQFCTISVIEQKRVRIFAQGEIFVRFWRAIHELPLRVADGLGIPRK